MGHSGIMPLHTSVALQYAGYSGPNLRHGTTSVREFVVRIEAHEVHDVDGGGGGHTLDQWVPAESPGADVARSRADVAGKKKGTYRMSPSKNTCNGTHVHNVRQCMQRTNGFV
jgi:hypothetical protein